GKKRKYEGEPHTNTASPATRGFPCSYLIIVSCNTIHQPLLLYLYAIVVTMGSIPLYDAIKKMRQLTECGIPFRFEFYSYNSTTREYGGLKVVTKAQLRQGMRNDQSDKADTLIGYYDYDKNGNRFFHIGLLMKFNGLEIQP